MPLFVCDKCHGIDNSACGGNYWTRLIDVAAGKLGSASVLCCECYTGKWHDLFPKRTFDSATENPEHYYYIPASLRKAKKPE